MLTTSETVCVRQGSALQDYGLVGFWSPEVVVVLPSDRDAQFGSPDKITITVAPGDTLNT